MDSDKPNLITGVVKTPRGVPGALHRFEAEVEMKDGPARLLTWDTSTRLTSVFDEKHELLGWTERQRDRTREVVLAGGHRPAVSFQDKLFSSVVWIEGIKFKFVMWLQGGMRVFGNDRLKLEHRDFKSEVRFRSVPELEIAAIIAVFEVYWSKVAPNGPTQQVVNQVLLIVGAAGVGAVMSDD